MTLQIIYPDGSRHFQALGDHFVYEDRYIAKDRFKETAEVHFGKMLQETPEHCIGFIVYDSGRGIQAIFQNNKYLVLGPEGTIIKHFGND